MSATNGTITGGASLQALQDRLDVTDVLYRYSAAVDRLDNKAVRSCLADDVQAKYGNAPEATGGDTVAAWIAEATASIVWQHHQLSVYRVEIDGDDARALSYLTSHQVFAEDPDAAKILVARYHDELRRTSDGWKISQRVMEILWGESRQDDGFLATVGGRGPLVWGRGQ
jgi:ketosteroid isomerase-like protein